MELTARLNKKMETKKIVCPFSKTEVELKAWITGEENNKIRKQMLDHNMAMKSDIEVNLGEAVIKTEKAKVDVVVISVAGEKKNIYEKICAMRKCDYSFVINEVNKIADDVDFLSEGGKPAAGIASAS